MCGPRRKWVWHPWCRWFNLPSLTPYVTHSIHTHLVPCCLVGTHKEIVTADRACRQMTLNLLTGQFKESLLFGPSDGSGFCVCVKVLNMCLTNRWRSTGYCTMTLFNCVKWWCPLDVVLFFSSKNIRRFLNSLIKILKIMINWIKEKRKRESERTTISWREYFSFSFWETRFWLDGKNDVYTHSGLKEIMYVDSTFRYK